MNIKMNMRLGVGRIVKFFVLSDLFLLAGWGLIEPIFSVFIIERVAHATLETVGIAAAIYWILKSVLEIPVANFLDRADGEKDDFLALIIGLLMSAFSALAFSWVHEIWELYLVQSIHAIAFGLYIPSWSGVFSRHLDKDRVSFDWSLDSTAAGFAAGISGLGSGLLAAQFGFVGIFVLASLLSLVAAFVIMFVPSIVFPHGHKDKNLLLEDHTPTNIGA